MALICITLIMYLCLHVWIRFSGGDTDERGPTKTSAAVEGWPSGPPNWICYFGGSGMNLHIHFFFLIFLQHMKQILILCLQS